MKTRTVRARNPLPRSPDNFRSRGAASNFPGGHRGPNSVLIKTKGPTSSKTAWLQGATRGKLYRWTTERKVHLASGKVTHSFLHIPDCPYPLLGRELLSKVGAQIDFHDRGTSITGPTGDPLQILTVRLEVKYKLLEPRNSPLGLIQD